MQPLDEPLFRLVNDLAGTSSVLDVAGVFAARYLIFIMGAVPVVMLAGRWWPAAERVHAQRAVYRALIASVTALAGNALIALSFFRTRPYVALDRVHALIGPPLTPKSFPSDHAAIAFAIAVSVWFAWPRLGGWMVAAAALVAASRVYVGVHYPGDVIVGAALGAFWAWAVRRVTDRHLYHDHRQTL